MKNIKKYKEKIEANNKRKFNFQGITLSCYDTEDPDRLVDLANKNYDEIKRQAAESMWENIDNEYDYGDYSEPDKLDPFFKKYPKYQDLIPQMQLISGQIYEDTIELDFKMKCKDPTNSKGRSVVLTISFDSNDKIKYDDIDF